MLLEKGKAPFNWKPKKGSFKKIQEGVLRKQGLNEEATPEQLQMAKKYGFDEYYADEIDIDWIKKSGVEKAWKRKSFDPKLSQLAKKVKQVVDKNGGFKSAEEAIQVINKAIKLGKPWDTKTVMDYGYGENMGWALGNGDIDETFPSWTIRDLAVNKEIEVNLETGKMSSPGRFMGSYSKAANQEQSEETGGGYTSTGFYI